jgi:hypothetical protein
LNKGIDQAIFRQDAAHSRQAFAHATICSSDFIFSHSAAQASQALAQATQAAGASMQDLAISCVERLQNSWQLIAIAAQAA